MNQIKMLGVATTLLSAGVATNHQSAQRLHHELRATRAKLVRADRALAESKRTLAQTDKRLVIAQAALVAAQQQVANLQTAAATPPPAPPPPPTPLAVAEQQVAEEVSWADNGAATPPGQLVAEAALDYVVGHVQLGAFGYLEDQGIVAPGWPTTDVNQTLSMQAGYCGHAAEVFKAIVEHFGYQVTGVWFTYTDPNGTPDGHTATEVNYDGSWHFFDPTFGQFWTDSTGNVLPIEDVRAGQGTRIKDDASFFNLADQTLYQWPNGDDTWFETDAATAVSVGDQFLP